MTQDIASLGIKVETGEVAKGIAELEGLTQAGAKAEKTTDSLSAASKKASVSIKAMAAEAKAAESSVDGTTKSFSALYGGTTALEAGMFSLGNSIKNGTFVESLKSTQEAKAWLASLNVTTKESSAAFLDAGQKLTYLSNGMKGLGAWSGTGKPVFGQIGKQGLEAAAGLTTFNKVAVQTGVSAAQTAAALRGVPAQFTDIVTSLQGGQSPLTVLLQQGGQLKDMFGGVGPAAKALGGYVLGLVNPFTVAAAAAAGLGLAYYKGSEEATAYNKALILSGNAAGISADQLGSLATQISSTIGTTGAAAEVLAQLAGSSKIAGESFGVVATAALQMQSTTGKAIEETVAEFASIGKDPVAAAKTLNDQYGFLTASVYSQIVALKEQGDTIGAAKLLTDTYADTIKTRTTDITANLSIWERAWKGVASETRKTLDAFNDIGRAEDAAKKIADLSQQVAYAKSAVAADPSDTDAKKKLQNSQLELTFLTQQRDTQAALAAAQGLYVERQKVSVNAQDKLNAGLTATASNQEKLRDRLKEIDALAKDSAAGDGGRVYTPAELNQLREAAKKQFTDKPGGSKALNLTGYNDSQNAIKDLQATYANSEKELEAQQKAGLITQQNYLDQRTALIRAEKEEVSGAYKDEISALEALMSKSSTTGEQRIQLGQKIADAKQAMVKAEKDAESQLKVLAINEEGRVTAQTAASKAYVAQLERQRSALEVSGTRAANGLGLGDRQQGLQNNLDGATDKFNEERAKLLDRRRTAPDKYSKEDYEKDLASLQTAEDRYRATVVGNYDKMSVAQSNWQSGATSAYANYLQSASDVAGQTKSLFTNAFSSMEDAIVNFAMTGKLSFSDFAKSVLSDMARIAVRQASSSALSGLFGLVANAFGGGAQNVGSSASASGYSTSGYAGAYGFDGGGYTGDGGKYQPAGIVHKGEVVIRKEVVQQRGMRGYLERLNKRGYADGGYVGSSDGSASQGGGGETPIVVNVDARDSGASGIDPVRLAEAVKVTVRQEIANQRRNGGQLT